MSSVSARLHHRVKLRHTPVGQGVFATRGFPGGEIVGRIDGKVIADGSYDSQYAIHLGDHRALEPKAPFRFLNHCCSPNCDIVYDDGPLEMIEDRVLFLQTRREIRKNEELTIDYAWPIEAAIPCLCGHADCRGWIVAEPDLPALLEQKRAARP